MLVVTQDCLDVCTRHGVHQTGAYISDNACVTILQCIYNHRNLLLKFFYIIIERRLKYTYYGY